MANPIPILFLGGAAFLFLSGKKKPKTKKKAEDKYEALPEPSDEDLDQGEAPERAPPSPTPIPAPVPIPEPIPVPVPQPEPQPQPEFEPEGLPSSKPPVGPSAVGLCVNQVYNRDPEYITPDIAISEKALTAFKEADYYFYIRRDFQTKLYNYMLARFTAMKSGQERRTVASVILREGLKHFNSGCQWEAPIDSLSEPERLVWDGGRRLAIMAQITVGIKDPSFNQLFKTGNRFTIPRDALGDPDPGFFGAQKKPTPDTRVEILVTDTTQESAEHIIGKISKMTGPQGEPDLFEIIIVDKFQGTDVAPRLKTKHGFKVGSNAYFSQKGPTGIYRIFPQGMV